MSNQLVVYTVGVPRSSGARVDWIMELLTVWVRNPSACFPSRRHPDRCPDSAQIMRMRLSSAKSFCSMGDGQILHSLHQRKIAIAVWWLGRGSAIRRTAEFEPRAWRSCRVQSTISSRTFEESLVLRCPVNADPRSLCRWVFFSTVDELFMRASKRRYGRSNASQFYTFHSPSERSPVSSGGELQR